MEAIPERPFLRPTMINNKAVFLDLMEKLIKQMFQSKVNKQQASSILGRTAQSKIQDAIVKLPDPPNADSTVESKGVNNPLIDTGALRQHINFAAMRR